MLTHRHRHTRLVPQRTHQETEERKKKSLGTISAQQRYSQSQRIHMAQIHQFKYVLHGEREYSFISHLNLDKKKKTTHVLLSWCINGKLVWKLSLQKQKSPCEALVMLTEWCRISDAHKPMISCDKAVEWPSSGFGSSRPTNTRY